MKNRAAAELLQRMHDHARKRILVLPTAWDAMSARIIEAAGARAISTTSAGISWAHGRRDGEGLDRDEMIEAIRFIMCAVRVPVTVDIEPGTEQDSSPTWPRR